MIFAGFVVGLLSIVMDFDNMPTMPKENAYDGCGAGILARGKQK